MLHTTLIAVGAWHYMASCREGLFASIAAVTAIDTLVLAMGVFHFDKATIKKQYGWGNPGKSLRSDADFEA
jgi:hypothetical protein